MTRTRSIVIAVTLIATLGICISVARSCGIHGESTSKPDSPNPSTAGLASKAVSETSKDPNPSESRADKYHPLITWSEVPDRWALWPASGIGIGKYRGAISAPTLRALLEMLQQDPEATQPEHLDAIYRAWGLMNSVDYLLAKASKLEPNDNAVSANRHYIPLLMIDGVRLPEDTAPARDALLGLFASGFEDVLKRVPKQHVAEGLEQAFSARAMMLLASLGNDPRTVDLLQEQVKSSDPRTKSAAAYGLILQGQSAQAIDILSQGEQNPAFRTLVGTLSGFHRKEVVREDGARNEVPDVQLDRSLDAYLLAAAQRNPQNVELATCLAARLDNPDIRAFVTSVLLSSDDPQSARAVVRVHPDLTMDPTYLGAAKRWVNSENPALKHWGLKAMSDIRDAAIPAIVSPMIHSGDAMEVYNALVAQKSSVLLDAPRVITSIKAVFERKMMEGGIVLYAKEALMQIAKAPSVSDDVKREAHMMLAKMGGGISR